MTLTELSQARARCAHRSDWRRDSTRCPKTSDDGLPYFELNGARYCDEHGPQHPYANLYRPHVPKFILSTLNS